MSFGGYSYGPDEPDEPSEQDQGPPVVEAQYPELLEQCDHPNCTRETDDEERVCDRCTEIMIASKPRRCDVCGATVN